MKKIILIMAVLCMTGCKKYSCPNEYELNGKECYIKVEEKTITKQLCEDGYKLDNNICKKTIFKEAKKTENCPSGYKKDDNLCISVSTKAANKKTWCEKGKIKSGGCYIFSVENATLLGKYCPDGYNTEGSRCYKKIKSKPMKDMYGMLKCPSDQTFELGYCIKKVYVNKIDNYVCSTGTLKGTKCEIMTWVGVPKSEYSCSNGYNLIGTKCAKTDVKNVIINYNCEEGFELEKDNKCKKILSENPKEIITCNDGLKLKNDKCIGQKSVKAELK